MCSVVCAATLETVEQPRSIPGVVTGILIGFADEGLTPLVTFPGQSGTAAVAARSIVDLHRAHLGRQVVLMFDGADPSFPIVMGWLRQDDCSVLADPRGSIDVERDGERVIVSAKDQVVLRCGKASITLTKAGKVLIEGAYVLCHSSGVNRIKGASVQIN